MNLLVSRELVRSSSIPSLGLSGRSTGLKERLPSGVVGAVELSRVIFSSSSTGGEQPVAMMRLSVVSGVWKGDS